MNITVEKYNTYKNASKELIEVIRNRLSEVVDYERNCFEDDFGFKFNDICYDVIVVDEPEFAVEGKYQSRSICYQLVSCDENSKSWVIDRFNLFFEIPESRTGSYYTDYYYSYEKPILFKAKLVHIPEQIIPAHDNVEFGGIEE